MLRNLKSPHKRLLMTSTPYRQGKSYLTEAKAQKEALKPSQPPTEKESLNEYIQFEVKRLFYILYEQKGLVPVIKSAHIREKELEGKAIFYDHIEVHVEDRDHKKLVVVNIGSVYFNMEIGTYYWFQEPETSKISKTLKRYILAGFDSAPKTTATKVLYGLKA